MPAMAGSFQLSQALAMLANMGEARTVREVQKFRLARSFSGKPEGKLDELWVYHQCVWQCPLLGGWAPG